MKQPKGTLTVPYTNYKGETSTRNIFPVGVEFQDNNKYHGQTWILKVFDVDKEEYRDFDLVQLLEDSYEMGYANLDNEVRIKTEE